MKLGTIVSADASRVCVVRDEEIRPTQFPTMIDLIASGPAGLESLRRVAGLGQPIAGAHFLAPIPQPGKVICAGINYRSHLLENPKATLPTRPFFFAKLTSAVIGPGEPIVKPYPQCQLDYEVELAIVIGRRARKVSAVDAHSFIFGYTILNDVSARELQFAPDAQMTLSKGLDAFCPLGPVIVTADEISNAGALGVRTLVNGQTRQSSTTEEWVFGLGDLLEALTAHVTLEPGDVVSTGTPAGVGLFRHPPTWLQPGDVVRVEIDGIGALQNHVIAGWDTPVGA
jgi:2-keto-4-pentenoate hydratase/2-oxohepta-3-ene-1,7-dioic acid hydratase in catechol pathway